MRAEKLHSAEMMSVSEKYRDRSVWGISNERDIGDHIQYGIPPPPAHQSSNFSHFSFRSLSESFGCKVFSLSVYSSNLRNFSYHIIKGLYATCSSWHIDPCRFPVKCCERGCVIIHQITQNKRNVLAPHEDKQKESQVKLATLFCASRWA